MNILWAIEQARFGRTIKREAWPEGSFLEKDQLGETLQPVKNLKNAGRRHLIVEDITADDWESVS